MANNAHLTLAEPDADAIARRALARLRGRDQGTPALTRRRGLAVTAVLALLGSATWILVRHAASVWPGGWRAAWDFLGRDFLFQQGSGYVALALFAVALLVPSRRLGWLARRRAGARVVHAAVGCATCVALVIHTGARLGHGLNLVLSLVMLTLFGLGAILALAWRPNPPQPPVVGRLLRPLHLWLLAPAVALIALHVVCVYYF